MKKISKKILYYTDLPTGLKSNNPLIIETEVNMICKQSSNRI